MTLKNKDTYKKQHSNNLAIILTIIGLGVATTTGGVVYATQTINEDLVVIGNVGIGTSSPTTPLSIMGNGGAYPVGITQNQVAGIASMELTAADTLGNQATGLIIRGNIDNRDIEFYTGARGSETITVHIEGDNGNVGIGTSSPNSKLEVTNGYFELDTSSGVPPVEDCDATDEIGRMKIDDTNRNVYVCANSQTGTFWRTL